MADSGLSKGEGFLGKPPRGLRAHEKPDQGMSSGLHPPPAQELEALAVELPRSPRSFGRELAGARSLPHSLGDFRENIDG